MSLGNVRTSIVTAHLCCIPKLCHCRIKLTAGNIYKVAFFNCCFRRANMTPSTSLLRPRRPVHAQAPCTRPFARPRLHQLGAVHPPQVCSVETREATVRLLSNRRSRYTTFQIGIARKLFHYNITFWQFSLFLGGGYDCNLFVLFTVYNFDFSYFPSFYESFEWSSSFNLSLLSASRFLKNGSPVKIKNNA